MKINFALYFNTGKIDFPGEVSMQGKGHVPLLSFLSNPAEQMQSKEVTEKITQEIHDWMTRVGFADKKRFKLASDVIRANLVGLVVPAVARKGYDSTVTYYKFAVLFFLIDDIFDVDDESSGSKDDSNSPCSHEKLMEMFSKFKQAWNNPKSIHEGNLIVVESNNTLQIILNAWYSLIEDVQRLCPLVNGGDSFISEYQASIENTFGVAKQIDLLFNSEVAYRRYRKCNGFTFPFVEFAALICNISIDDNVRKSETFKAMIESCADVISFENDLFSLKKEQAQNEKLNLILIKINQGTSPLEAFNATLRCVWDNMFQFMHLGNQLMEEFPDQPTIHEYINIMVELMNGNPPLHVHMDRYIGFCGKQVELPRFNCLKDQEFFVYRNLLKSDLFSNC